MSDDKLRVAAAELVRIMVTHQHSDLCQEGGDCVICDAMCGINAALADSAEGDPVRAIAHLAMEGMKAGIKAPPPTDAPPEPTEEMVVVGHDADDCWTVKVNGEYIHHFVYEGDAHGMASRLRRAITQEVKP